MTACKVDTVFYFFFQAEDGIRDLTVTGVQTCALPILALGQRAVVIASNALTPRSVAIHLNLASALLMSGDRDGAQRAVVAAEHAIRSERSWTTNMEFLLGYACFALETGDVILALQLTESTERLAWGKERAVPNAGLFDKLRVYRLVHTSGPDSARP